MPTPRNELDRRTKEWRKSFAPQTNYGLIVGALKSVFGSRLWRWAFLKFVQTVLERKGLLDKEFLDQDGADALVRRTIDWYIFSWLIFLAILYSLARFFASCCAGGIGCVVVLLTAVISAFRVLEILAVVAELHAAPGYKPRDPVRALVDAIWNYLEVGIAFATIHFAVAFVGGDNFGGKPYTWFTPVYFSFVTLTTVGFGDYAPTKTVGQMLVVAEVVVGMVLLVIVVQRAVATTLVHSTSHVLTTRSRFMEKIQSAICTADQAAILMKNAWRYALIGDFHVRIHPPASDVAAIPPGRVRYSASIEVLESESTAWGRADTDGQEAVRALFGGNFRSDDITTDSTLT